MQANEVSIYVKPGCGLVRIAMFPEQVPDTIRVDIPKQHFTPAGLRVLARILEQAADRKEEAFEVAVTKP